MECKTRREVLSLRDMTRVAVINLIGNRGAAAALVVLLGLLLWGAPRADAQPVRSPPTLRELLSGNILAQARLRWSKVVDGQRVEILISGGAVERRDPRWATQLARLPFNLDDNLRLGQALKQAQLPALKMAAAPSPAPQDRTLEILSQGSAGWAVIGTWAMPEARWRKGRPALHKLLEPLFTVSADVFAPMQREAR